MKRFITSNAFLYTAGLVFVFFLWLLISASRGEGNLVFPSPASTFSALGTMLQDGYIYQCLGMSLLRTLEGFGISFALAFIIGSLAGEIAPLQRFFKPLILVFKSAPTAALVFLFLVLSGSSKAPVWIVGILAFPILYEAFVAGINAVPQEIKWASKVDSARFFSTVIKIKVPLALPYVLLGVLSSFALSFKTEIMAELVSGSTSPGLGGAIRMYRNEDPSNLSPIFAIAVLAITLVLFVDLLIFVLKKIFAKPNS